MVVSFFCITSLQMNSLGICYVTMVLTHPFLHHFRGKARWYLALFVMKNNQAEEKILHSSFHPTLHPQKMTRFQVSLFQLI